MILVVVALIVGVRLFWKAQEKNDIKEVASADSSLINEALAARKDRSNMGFMRLFNILKRNINKRDTLIEKAKSLEVSYYKEEIDQFIGLMQIENEFLRSALFFDQGISSAVASVRSAPSVRAESIYKSSRAKLNDYTEIVDELIEKEKNAQTSLSEFMPERSVLMMMEKEKKKMQDIIDNMELEMEKKKKAAGKK
jgi:hypothetical protein